MPPTLRTTTALFALTCHALACLALACAAADSDDPGVTTTGTTDANPTTFGTSAPSSTGPDETADTTAAQDSSGPSPTGTETSDSTEGGDSTGTPSEPGPDLRERGPHEVDVVGGSVQTGPGGCVMAYDVFAPADVVDAPTVLLAHGFQGNRGTMAGWAEHWASWGVRVVTPDLCQATIINADHLQNGADLVTLAEHLDVGAVGLAGYSAGGAAALIAAAAMPDALLLLGLDLVDSGGLGLDASADVVAPTHGITAETAMCNGSSNGLPVLGAIDGSLVVRLIDADHCDFQNPGGGFCQLCAEDNTVNTPEEIRAAIFGLSTAAVLWRMGVEPTGAQWWTPGSAYYDALFDDGLLAQL